jgi:hypothetical protein
MNTPASEEAAARQKKYEEMMLPPDFEARIQQLPSSTLVHIPSCLRQRVAEILTANLLGMQRDRCTSICSSRLGVSC